MLLIGWAQNWGKHGYKNNKITCGLGKFQIPIPESFSVGCFFLLEPTHESKSTHHMSVGLS